METVEKILEDSLRDMVNADMEEFIRRLAKDHKCISRSDTENASRLKTVDIMVERFGPEKAVKITVEILRKMHRTNPANQLEKEYNKAQAEGSGECPEPKPTGETDDMTKNIFLQYYHQFTADPNTVNKQLQLSVRNTVITYTDTPQSYPDNPERFDYYPLVLCRESVNDRRCYWETECFGDVYIAVSYKSITRKGTAYDSWFGYNDKSWSLMCSPSSYAFMHNSKQTSISLKPTSGRVGVYVDHRAGTLSFYNFSGDTMIPIHTVQTTFTQPLYPGFRVGNGSVKLLMKQVL
ncbi:tripartite motif-containing protein 16-like protein [Megalobrama amblycephala]|uniref:tripartite motif-containing protein 16-like protein n=1 Tax=Megalobrama amblycephala TaxID=75352 RepID=UPI002013CB7C|nr:tripartite motif-containing protein 16-like protein [Megalobrama amblycephala]